ncbi:MMPL family transporter [Cryptosporangium arvum]|uniref:Putative RND superfamily drug exporter n=1 Tax=Cryptosporangium arvum DSM 44712 TaxID=927661 RepID=A0A011A0H3_9ACTN|nr:MMPL family transporter [Cryptosporangium arvum]EXG82992.1 putative RND superfamily drug exporter [Cryptosporangium arvum DSM 44712]
MATLLHRLGRGAFRHRGVVLGAWAAVLALLIGLVVGVGGSLDNDFSIPGSESQQARDTLSREFPAAAGATAQIVFSAPAGERITDYTAVVTRTLDRVTHAPQVEAVQTGAVSADQRTSLAQVEYAVEHPSDPEALEQAVEPAERAGLTVSVGGAAFSENGVSVSALELIGVGVALLVLVVTFGSLLAAGLPLVTALVGVGVGLLGLLATAAVGNISSTAITLALMIGLAVGIDYALFIVSRHRTQLARGMDPEESAALANGTAGSAVVFAGLTVIIALAGLSVVGIPFLTVMGLGAAATVLVAVLVALTVVPALLGFAGARLVPKPGSRAERRGAPDTTSGGERWARIVTRRPAWTVLAVVVGLLVLAIPAKDLRLALPDGGSAAEGTHQRVTYDAVSEAFGPGFNGPLLVLAHGDADRAALVAKDLGALTNVVAVTPPVPTPDGEYALIQVIPRTGPDAQATTDLVDTIRDRAGAIEAQTGVRVQVTGNTAIAIDVSDRLSAALVPFAAVVVGLCLVLLLVVFRSLVVPLKATIGFLLSVGASFGATAAVFEWGWLADVLGVGRTGPVISFLPIILMAVLFGLAMDYEVFLVSGIREEWVRTGKALASVHGGARHASRVVTAAALIMFSVFATFVIPDDAIIKPIAFSLAVGVLIDAFVVRMTLVPAVLALVGRGAWWLPGWLDRLLPRVDIEGESLRGDEETAPKEPVAVG